MRRELGVGLQVQVGVEGYGSGVLVQFCLDFLSRLGVVV